MGTFAVRLCASAYGALQQSMQAQRLTQDEALELAVRYGVQAYFCLAAGGKLVMANPEGRIFYRTYRPVSETKRRRLVPSWLLRRLEPRSAAPVLTPVFYDVTGFWGDQTQASVDGLVQVQGQTYTDILNHLVLIGSGIASSLAAGWKIWLRDSDDTPIGEIECLSDEME